MRVLEQTLFDVIGIDPDGEYLVLRRFRDETQAGAYLASNLHRRFTGVHVKPVAVKIPSAANEAIPPFPWRVEWCGSFAYLIDRNGRRIASLLGPQAQREALADFLTIETEEAANAPA